MHESYSLITKVPRLTINLHIMIMIIGNYEEKGKVSTEVSLVDKIEKDI